MHVIHKGLIVTFFQNLPPESRFIDLTHTRKTSTFWKVYNRRVGVGRDKDLNIIDNGSAQSLMFYPSANHLGVLLED